MKKVSTIIQIIICVIVLALVSFEGLAIIKGSTDDLTPISQGYRNRTQVVIHNDIKTGRGIIVNETDEYIDIVTAKHLVEDAATLSVETSDKKEIPAELVYEFKNFDSAVIRIQKTDSDAFIPHPIVAEYISEDEYNAITPGTLVYYLDGIYDSEHSVSEGIWSDGGAFIVDFKIIAGVFNGTVRPGMSGEGVFTEDGRWIGMIIAASDEEGALLPAHEIMKNYDIYVR